MTREEAITALGDRNNLLWGMSKEEKKYYSEALDMAISALSTEGEYIKKEDAISKILIEFTKREENEKFMCTCADVKQTCADILDGLQTYSIPDSAENKGDLISRQAVLDELEKWDWQDSYLPIHFKQILDDIPSADVRPNIHGHWIEHKEHCESIGAIPSGLGGYKWCSNCDCGIDVREWHRNNYNFCPDCGADMRDEDVSGIFKGQTSISLEGLDKWSIEEAGKIKLKGDKAE